MAPQDSSSIYSTVVARNNRAVDDMLNGHLASAHDGFRDCFILVKQCLATGGEQGGRQNSHEEEGSIATSTVRRSPPHEIAAAGTPSLSSSSSSLLRLAASPKCAQTLQNEDDMIYVYDRPILFCYKNGVDYDIIGTGQLLSAALIFNMALLFHIKKAQRRGWVCGLTPRSAKGDMAKAQQLYLTVVKLTDCSGDEGEGENRMNPSMLTMFPKTQRQQQTQKQREYASKWKLELGLAAVNNYSQLCHELGELEMAERAVTALQSSMSELSHQLYAFSTSEWDQILSNIVVLLLLSGGVRIPCAPAA